MVDDKPTWDPEHLAVVIEGPEAIATWRRSHPGVQIKLDGANLEGLYLCGADLSGARFFRTRMVEARLRGANLRGANFGGADLHQADLEGADLTNAHFGSADLTGVNLVDALLVGAKFHGAVLHCEVSVGTDFSGAIFLATSILSDLTPAHGLELVGHRGRSIVAADLLLRPTERPWPTQFLRGCGLTDFEIEHTRGIATNPIEFYSCFISYSTKDDRFAVKLHEALQAQGIRCWLDKHEVLPGDNIYAKVNEAIRQWDKVLLCCSEYSLASWWVKDEIVRTLEKERRLEKERGHEVLALVPLDLDGYLFDEERCTQENAPTLRKRHAAKFAGWQSDDKLFDAQLARVVKALRADDLARPKPPKSKL